VIGYIARAEDAPCATIVLDRRLLPESEDDLLKALAVVRKQSIAAGRGDALKIALICPSVHPLYDIDYEFAQIQPNFPARIDLQAACAHSVLAAAVVASEWGWIPALSHAMRVRVRIVNTGDQLVCEVNEASRGDVLFTAHFVPRADVRFTDLLPAHEPMTTLRTAAGRVEVSLVSVGNPYVFVDAESLGMSTLGELFADKEALYRDLAAVRAAGALRLGLPRAGVLPKIAVVGGFHAGRIAARAISVPGWHPTLALTGAVCLGVASWIPGTIPHALARAASCSEGELAIETPGGRIVVHCDVSRTSTDDFLRWTSVRRKARVHGRSGRLPQSRCGVTDG
jgi:2-methylaconitate cis-trans-isomerase PrpF